jgi:hypothetical protein
MKLFAEEKARRKEERAELKAKKARELHNFDRELHNFDNVALADREKELKGVSPLRATNTTHHETL